jgi:hypothetical protein
MLPDLPGIGLWTIETHSYYASLWTAGMVEMLESLAKNGRVCEAMLTIERQTRKGKHGVRHFSIPTIMPMGMTPRQLFAAEMQAAIMAPEEAKPKQIAVADEQKTLAEHIEDVVGMKPYAQTPRPPFRPGAPPAGTLGGTYVAQIEAIILGQKGDIPAFWAWAERQMKKAQMEFSEADYQALLRRAQGQANAKKGTTVHAALAAPPRGNGVPPSASGTIAPSEWRAQLVDLRASGAIPEFGEAVDRLVENADATDEEGNALLLRVLNALDGAHPDTPF